MKEVELTYAVVLDLEGDEGAVGQANVEAGKAGVPAVLALVYLLSMTDSNTQLMRSSSKYTNPPGRSWSTAGCWSRLKFC